MGVDHEFDRVRIVSLAHLCIGHGVLVSGLPSHQTGESFAPSVDEVEPEMVGERTMSVGAFGITEEIADDGDGFRFHVTFDVEEPHTVTLPLVGNTEPFGTVGRWLLDDVRTMPRLVPSK